MSEPLHYRFSTPAVAAASPVLDVDQQRVVDHREGPMLVLAGPGTGKTTTLVEAIVARIEEGAAPDSVLAMTFSRKAATELRDRVIARLGRTTSQAMVSTFHSFAYALLRARAPHDLYAGPLRLLSAPEQDVVLRELLVDHEEAVRWPDFLRAAVPTRGFAGEVQALLARAREKGLDAEDLHRLGQECGRPELETAGRFLDHYLTNLDAQSATDYADLIRRAVLVAEDHRDELRSRYEHVFVDEYQDTDPAQVALLRTLAGDGRNLLVVGDPHQSIYRFRGAEVRGILDFPRSFPRADQSHAPVVSLRTTRRFGPRLLTASQRVAARLPLAGSIDSSAREGFLSPTAAPAGGHPGQVEVLTFDTDRGEAEHLADLLRRAHLEDGIAWDQMAVLVRSGRSTLPPLRRALGAAGVPVEVAGDELPLMVDPACRVLLDALRAVVNLDNDDPGHVDHIDAGRAEALLVGPLGGLDAAGLRRLARELRTRSTRAAETGQAPASPSRTLVRRAVLEPGFLDGLTSHEATVARALHDLLFRARRDLEQGASAEQLLWLLWSGAGWARRLRRAVEQGGAAARRAHRDLDAVVALFAAAARVEEQRDHTGVHTFLETLRAQQIPADTLAERGLRGAAVRLLTAHRSKGVEWDLVVVAHVQNDGWPDLRRRTTLLQADTLGTDGLEDPPTTRELLAEERRLFYVACTRARRRLVVTAVRSPEDEGEQPSRFTEELGVEVRHRSGRPHRPLSVAGLVAHLRRTLTDPETSPALRQAAARRLARLAGERATDRPDGTPGRALVPAADPATWWGTRSLSRSETSLRDPEAAMSVSATMLESVLRCPLQWFLEREAGGVSHAHQSANIGLLVHTLAERVGREQLENDTDPRSVTPQDVEVLMEQVDRVWSRLEFRTPWSSAREHDRIRAALTRFLNWHRHNPRELIAVEQRFSTEVDLGEAGRVRLSGFADRLELDADGRVVVVDLKTGRNKEPDVAVRERNLQLGLYQYAVDHGAVADVRPSGGGCGGAELVHLGLSEPGEDATVQPQPAQTEVPGARDGVEELIAHAVTVVRDESFPATIGKHCRYCTFESICPARTTESVVHQ